MSEDKVSFGYKLVTASEKRKLVNEQFKAIARTYDLADSLLSLGLHFLWKRITIRMLSLKQGESVLDLCGGTADLALLAAKDIGKEGKVIVYDINLINDGSGPGKGKPVGGLAGKLSLSRVMRRACASLTGSLMRSWLVLAFATWFTLKQVSGRYSGY